MASTRLRSFAKGVAWEATAPLILYFFTQKWHVIVGYTLTRIAMYFIFERIWHKIKWGKYKEVW